jgi:hypothetical protein
MPHKIDEAIARICGAAVKPRRSGLRPAAEGNGNGKE